MIVAPPRIWIDVEDLFDYAAKNTRPSGIQRLAYEICRALATSPQEQRAIGFVRHAPAQRSFRIVEWREVEAVYADMSRRAWTPPRATTSRPMPARGLHNRLRRLALRLPRDIREPLFVSLMHQSRALGALAAAARAIVGPRRRRASPKPIASERKSGEFATEVRPGDTVLALGAFWFHPNYVGLIEKARSEHGIRFALLVYDMIPLLRPEWCEPDLVRIFREAIHGALPAADVLVTISQASAADVRRYTRAAEIAIRCDPTPIPLGTGFYSPSEPAAPTSAPTRQLPEAGSYALVVATVEVRKNHILLFNVWRRLLDDLPREVVPTLVIAGRVGWLVADLLEQLANCAFLGGKIVLFEDVSDGELGRLYAGCRFTLFPSFYEGWGLPVSESLSFGQPCLASSATSLPEAGGSLARYFDPGSADEAYTMIRGLLERPNELREWRAQIGRDFRPSSWDASAQALITAIQPPAAASFTALGSEA